MRLGAKKILDVKVKDIINEMKNNNVSESKKDLMKESKAIAKKHTN